MVCVTFLFWFSQYTFTPYLNPELQAMGAAAAFMGLVSGSYGLAQLLTRLPIGIAADRWHCPRLFVLAGCVLTSLSAFGMYFWYTPAGFLFGRTLSGLAASTWVTFTVLYGSYFPAGQSAQAISMLNAANQAGRLACFVLVALLVRWTGERGSLLVAGLAGLLALLFCVRIREGVSSGEPIRLRQLPALLQNRNLLVCTLLATLIQTLAFGTYQSFTANHAAGIGAGAAELSYVQVALMAPMLLVNYLVARRLLARFGPRPLLAAGFTLSALYCFLLPMTGSMPAVYALQAVAGAGNSLTIPVLLGSCVQEIEPRSRATAMGFFQAVYGLGMTAGPMMTGYLTDWAGLGAAFWAMGGVGLLTLVLTLVLLPRQRHGGR